MTRGGGNNHTMLQMASKFSEIFSENPRYLIDFIFPQRPDEKQVHRLQRVSRALRVTPRKAQSIYYNEPRAKNEDAYLFIIIRAKFEVWLHQQDDDRKRQHAASCERFRHLWGEFFDEVSPASRSDHADGPEYPARASRLAAERRLRSA